MNVLKMAGRGLQSRLRYIELAKRVDVRAAGIRPDERVSATRVGP